MCTYIHIHAYIYIYRNSAHLRFVAKGPRTFQIPSSKSEAMARRLAEAERCHKDALVASTDFTLGLVQSHGF